MQGLEHKKNRNLLVQAFQEFKSASWAFFHTEGFWKYVFIAFCLYLLGIIAIVRADVYYIDDWGRAAIGYKEWDNFSRYISYYLSTLMHMDTILADIAPLTQFVAIGFLSFASVIVVWTIREIVWKDKDSDWESTEVPYKKRLSVIGIIASIPIGLSPYFLEELSFRFDSPYMALSVLFSVIPFVFIHHIRAYVPISILCSLCMCMTYQASSGIEILFVLFFSFIMLNQTNAGLKKTFTFIGVSMLNYAIALGIFKFFIMHPFAHSQAGTATLDPSNLVSGFIKNLETYLSFLWNDFGWSGIKICFFILAFFFILSAVYQSKINKILSLILAIFVLVIGISISYGVYLILAQPLERPRAFIGIGVFCGMLAIYVVSSWRGWAYKKQDIEKTKSKNITQRNMGERIFFVCSAVSAGFFSWALIVFAYGYGNALASQKEYQNFRLTILLNDLANALPRQVDYRDYLFRIKGWVTSSPALENSSKSNRIMKRLVLITDGKYWVRMAMKHYGWGEIPQQQFDVVPASEDPAKIAENPKCNPETAGRLLKHINNMYHKIEVYPQCTIITFKGEEKYTHQELEEEKKMDAMQEQQKDTQQDTNDNQDSVELQKI